MLKAIQSLFTPIKVVESYITPDEEELLAALRSSDFARLEAALSERQEHDVRFGRIATLSENIRDRPAIAKWQAKLPDSYHAALVRGASDIGYAWAARGTDWKPQNYPEFQRRLQEAHARLDACCARQPKDPAPWVHLLPIAMGRELGPEETTRFFNEAHKRSGPSASLGNAAVQAFAPKWGAPDGALQTVIRSMCEGAPPGHRAHALQADVAIELVLYRCHRLPKIEPGMFTMPEMAVLINHAEQFWHKSPHRKPGPLDAACHASLAYCHWNAGNTALAEPHLRAVYPVFQEYPWGLSGDPASTARRAAKDCGL